MQRKQWILIMIVLWGMSIPAWAQTTQGSSVPVAVQLEKAIHAEETLGNLDEAIRIYGDIAKTAEASRSTVAKAYFRLGKCYLKKGQRDKAMAAFQTLVTQYPEQKELVVQAQAYVGSPSQASSPSVVSTTPKALANDVPTSLTKMSVTFDQPMMDGGWSWTGGGETFPKTEGPPSYDSSRTTCSFSVKLEPGKVYWVGINSPSHRNFKNAEGVPARRYVILFATRSADGKPTPIPEDMLSRAKAINDRHYQVSDADRKEAERLAAEGWQLWQQQKFREAEDVFKKAVAKDPRNTKAWNGLGWSQVNQGMPLNAKDSFERCVAIEPKHAAALNGLGWIAKGQGKISEAIGYWRKAIEAAPDATAALNGLAETAMEQKQYAEAITYYQKWLAVEPNDRFAKRGLQLAREKAGLTTQPSAESEQKEIQQLILELSNPKPGDQPFTALNELIMFKEKAVPALIAEMPGSRNWQIPKALGAIGDKRAVGPLVEKLQASDGSPMREVVVESLELLTGKKFGPNAPEWKKWWDAENAKAKSPQTRPTGG